MGDHSYAPEVGRGGERGNVDSAATQQLCQNGGGRAVGSIW